MNDYQELKNELLDEFCKSLSDEEKALLVDPFLQYLDAVYLSSYIKNIENGKSNETQLEMMKDYADYITALDINGKKSNLILDENFIELNEISSEIFDKAKGILYEGVFRINRDEYLNYKKQLKELMSKIELFNKSKADKIYSETILDLEYCFEETTITSLRLGRHLMLEASL